MNLSILIPNFNRNINSLVEELIRQSRDVLHAYEILVADDGSGADTLASYIPLEAFKDVKIIFQEQNLGRAETRNNLAGRAQYENILFIDSDALISSDHFLKNYFDHYDQADVVVGGTRYLESKPEKPYVLRWMYGRSREQIPAGDRNKNPYATFSAFNFVVKKSVFDMVRFREDLKEYGHEDTLFGLALQRHGFSLLHIDNPLIHVGLDSSTAFLGKTEMALENLVKLERDPEIKSPLQEQVRLLQVYHRLEKWHLQQFVYVIYRLFKQRIKRNLTGPNPFLWCYQWFKLAHIHHLKKFMGPSIMPPLDGPPEKDRGNLHNVE